MGSGITPSWTASAGRQEPKWADNQYASRQKITNGSLTLYNCWQSREVKCQSPVEAKISTNSCKDGGFCFPVHDNALRGSCQSCHQQRIELSLKKHKTGIKCLFERSCRPFASISAAARRSWSHRSKFLQMSRKFGCSEYISWLPS